MAILLNESSALRFRLDLHARESLGINTPASLVFNAAMEVYRHAAGAEPAFVPSVEISHKVLLDVDLLTFLERCAALAERDVDEVSWETTNAPHFGVRIVRPELDEAGNASPDGLYLCEVGIDLAGVEEAVQGAAPAYGVDLALFRFVTAERPLAQFVQALIEEYDRFPTDPSKVERGSAT